MTTETICISIADGKYTLRVEADNHFHCLRHGEKWRDLTGDGMVLALVHEIELLKEKLQDAKECLECSSTIDPAEVCNEAKAILDEYDWHNTRACN